MNKNLVIIDDEEINIEIIREIISSFEVLKGYNFHTFSNPKDALEFCLKYPTELILLDQYMPDLDGLEFLDLYNQRCQFQEKASVIMISSDTSSEMVSNALSKGIDDFFPKPFDVHIMQARIQNCICKNQMRNEILAGKQSKELLLRVLLHDISSPLTIAQVNAKMIETQSPNPLLSKTISALQTISDMISSIRQIESLETNKIILNRSSVKLLPLVHELLELEQTKLSEKQLQVHIQLESKENIVLKTDPQILKFQILLNLLSNAIKFSDTGANIDIIIKKENNDYYSISIKDYGIGIPDEILRNIYRWDIKTSRRGTLNEKGTGFGLPIAKKFIDLLDYKLEVETIPLETNKTTHGTTFKVTLN